MSQALAWQTTSRSRGFTNSERSQNVFGSGAKPSEVKKPSPYFTMPMGSTFFAFSRSVMSYGCFCCGGAHQRKDVAPLLRPGIAQQVGANHAVGVHRRRAILLDQLGAHVGVQRIVERLHLLPQPLDLVR